MPLVKTRGAASAQGFGEFAKAGAVTYIEDVFNTYLYTGTGAALTITNGIDLSTKGGLVWTKKRNFPINHFLFDTLRGANYALYSSSTLLSELKVNTLSSFNTNGFSIGTSGFVNEVSEPYVSWTFRKQPKFFDVLTWTGTGSNTTIAHSLGSVPACIIVKRTDTTGDWQVYHRSLANTEYVVLNTTAAKATGATRWNSTTPTSTVFSLGTDATVNASGGTYVAYIYAHDAGGFGLTGTDNVISCGSFTTDGSGNTSVTLGYEPQWVMVKRTSGVSDWTMFDTMRGMPTAAASGVFSATLLANTTAAEDAAGGTIGVNSTGFNSLNGYLASSSTFIYIAIRRGPMKVPTTGTSVFSPIAVNAMQNTQQTTNFPVDMQLIANSGGETRNFSAVDRLRGVSTNTTSKYLGNITSSTDAESASVVFATQNWNSTGFEISANTAETTALFHSFKRAPSFMDIVCYTGTGSNTTQTHNLGVVPELIIVKRRNTTGAWDSYCSALSNTEYVVLNTTAAKATGATRWNSTTPTSSVFSVGTSTTTNASAGTYVAYLFATCAGVSKVGSYTGNGSTQTINCGLTAGARFVLIKKTSSTGDWYVYDTARGMTILTDPYLLLNTTAAEVATLGSVTTVATGFALNSTILAAINVSAATFIFLAIG